MFVFVVEEVYKTVTSIQ